MTTHLLNLKLKH